MAADETGSDELALARRRGGHRHTTHAGLRTAAIVLAATALPVLGLLWASGVARVEVENRALAGLTATAKATVLHEQQAWDDAIRVVTSAASRPVAISALQARDLQLASQGVQNILITGPFAAVRIYSSAGDLVALAALDGVIPTPVGTIATTGPLTVGDPVTAGSRIVRQVSVGFTNGIAGRLVVDVDLSQLLGRPSGLGFGRTGVKFLVTPTGLIVAGSTAVGTTLQSPVNRAIAAAGEPVTKRLFSVFFGRDTVESFEPVPGQRLGILVQQSRSEVMAGADHLAGRLELVTLAVGVSGAVLAGSLGLVMSRRGRKLAASERELADTRRVSRRRLEQFLDAIPIGVFVATPDGRPHYANREAQRLLGPGMVPAAAGPPHAAADMHPAFLAGSDEPYPPDRLPLTHALAGTTSHEDDIEIRTADGSVPVEVWGSPVLDGHGTVEFGIIALADVSERRRAEVKFQGLLESAPDAIVVVGADGLIRLVNRQTEVLFGYARAELVGQPVERLMPDRLAALHPTARTHFFASPSVRAMGAGLELAARRKDGSEFPVDISLAPLETAEGVLVSAAVRDVTERVRVHDALLKREKQLAAARDQALEASRLKSQFLANTSHEIRTPMTVILGMNELLMDTDLDRIQRTYADGVSRAGTSLLRIINDILDFSKIEAGHLDLQVTDVEVQPLVEEIGLLLVETARAKGLYLACSCDPGVPTTLRGDAARLRQILLNLTSNALKFTSEGGVEVRAGLRTSRTGNFVRFEVTDTGIGIAAEDQHLLFLPFSQVDGSPTRPFGGTGLGLAISSQMVEAMGGRIGMTSVPGSGSTFWFEIPALPGSAGRDGQPAAVSVAAAGDRST